MESTKKRLQVSQLTIERVLNQTDHALKRRLDEKGYGTFSSTHEIQGVITEEYHELIDALREDNIEVFKHELEDILVGCLFALCCIEEDIIEW